MQKKAITEGGRYRTYRIKIGIITRLPHDLY